MDKAKTKEHRIHADVYAFLKAAKANRIAEVKEAIAGGLDANSRNDDFNTALHFAAANGHLELVMTKGSSRTYLDEFRQGRSSSWALT